MDGLSEPPPPPSGVVHLPHGRPRDLVAGGGRQSNCSAGASAPLRGRAHHTHRGQRGRDPMSSVPDNESHWNAGRVAVLLSGSVCRHRRLPTARRGGARARARLRARLRRLLHDRHRAARDRHARAHRRGRGSGQRDRRPHPRGRARPRPRARRAPRRAARVRGHRPRARRGRLPARRRSRRAGRRRPARVRHPPGRRAPAPAHRGALLGGLGLGAGPPDGWTGTWRAGSGRS